MKCPFCSEPSLRTTVRGTLFRCGTYGPDGDGQYSTGHTCDIHTWTRLLAARDAEIERLTAFENRTGDHPLVMAEGGVDNADRCHRVINRQQSEIEQLRKQLAGVIPEE